MRAILASVGPRDDVAIAFRQSTQNAYNFVGSATGLTNSDSLEVVISVTEYKTVSFRVYPYYHGGYINLNRAKDRAGLMHKLLNITTPTSCSSAPTTPMTCSPATPSRSNSGFPNEAVTIVLRSLRNQDKYVGEMRPLIDGK